MLEKDFRTYSQDEELVEKRREQIVLSASSLFIRKGFDRTSMRELSDAFGLSKGGIYHYIGSKDDILSLILKYNTEKQTEFFKDISERVRDLNVVDALSVVIKSHLDRIDKYQDMYIFINHVMPHLSKQDRRTMYADSERLVDFFISYLKKGIATGDFFISDTWFVAWDIMHTCHRWAFYRWTLRKRYTLDDFKNLVTGRILSQIKTKPVAVVGT